MDRRDFHRRLAATAAATLTGLSLRPDAASATATDVASDLFPQDDMMKVMARFVDELAQGDPKVREMIAPTKPRQIALLAYPGMFPLDLLGPKAIFEDLLSTHVHIVAKSKSPVPVGRHAQLLPDVTLADCPESLDVIFVPGGGAGTAAMMGDLEVHAFLQRQAKTARYVTSVCTGSMVLASAGLLRGYRATSHWLTRDLLAKLGAIPVEQRVVEDRNRITSAGVTAGLDLAFVVAAKLASVNYAKAEMLNVEYDPDPPFRAGSPKDAGTLVTGALRGMYAPLMKAMEHQVDAAVSRLG
jgi:cyclohexyl-isocyanide hydratase